MELMWQLSVLEQVHYNYSHLINMLLINIEKLIYYVTNHNNYHAGSALEREGHDRSDINLPGKQVQLLQDVTNSVPSKLTSCTSC